MDLVNFTSNVNNPLVSILMTAYNREKYIAQAIESVLNSTYKDFELIVVDDQSKDNTVEIARYYEQQDDRIKVYVNEKNLGDYPNRNRAASYATGKYIKYVDADDLVYPYGLEQLVYYMEQFPEAGYGLCSLNQDKTKIYPFQLSPKEAYHRHYFEESIFHKAPLSAIINRDAFWQVGGFSGKQHLGDYEMWHLLSKNFPVVLMPHGIVWYRVHNDQQMNDNLSDPFVPFKYLLFQKRFFSTSDTPLMQNEKEQILRRVNLRISKSIISAYRRHGKRKGDQLLKFSGFSFLQVLKFGVRKGW